MNKHDAANGCSRSFASALKRAYYFARLYEYNSLSYTVCEVRVWKRSKTRRDGEHYKEELEHVD